MRKTTFTQCAKTTFTQLLNAQHNICAITQCAKLFYCISSIEMLDAFKIHFKIILKSISLSSGAVGVCLQILEILNYKIPSFIIGLMFVVSGVLLIVLMNLKTTIEEKLRLILASNVEEMRTIRNYLDDEIDRQTLRTEPII